MACSSSFSACMPVYDDCGSLSLNSVESESWNDITPSLQEDLGLSLSEVCRDILLDVSEIQLITDDIGEILQESIYKGPASTDTNAIPPLNDDANTIMATPSDANMLTSNPEYLCRESSPETIWPGWIDTQPGSSSLSFFDDVTEPSAHRQSSCLQDIIDYMDDTHTVPSSSTIDPVVNQDSGYSSGTGSDAFNCQDNFQYPHHTTTPETTSTSSTSATTFTDPLSAACIATDIPNALPCSAQPQPEAVYFTSTTVANKKPGEPHTETIAKAPMSAPDKKTIIVDIHDHTMARFPYYRSAPKSRKSAVRHRPSVNELFTKKGRATNGSGFYWALHPACLSTLQKGDFRRREARMLARQADKTRHDLVSHVSQAAARFQAISFPKTPIMTSTPVRGHHQTSYHHDNVFDQAPADLYQSYFASVAAASVSRY